MLNKRFIVDACRELHVNLRLISGKFTDSMDEKDNTVIFNKHCKLMLILKYFPDAFPIGTNMFKASNKYSRFSKRVQIKQYDTRLGFLLFSLLSPSPSKSRVKYMSAYSQFFSKLVH